MATKRRASGKNKKRRITAEDLLRFHWVSDAQIEPNGARVVFVKKHVGNQAGGYVRDLWMVATDGAAAPIQFTAGGADTSPRWSPDGSCIAFVGSRDKHRPQIFLIRADGGEASRLTDLPEGSIGDLRWAPDGGQIAFAFRPRAEKWTQAAAKEREETGASTPPRVLDDLWYRLDGDGYFDADRFALYVADSSTGEHRSVFDKDRHGLFSFDFSPDGRKLAIAANLDRHPTRPWLTELFTLDLKTAKLHRLPDVPVGPKESVQWSPDGRYLAYAGRIGETSSYDTANLELFLSDPVKGGARSVTGKEDYCLLASSVSDSADVDFSPRFRWHPNGKSLFLRLGWHGETHIATVRARGGPIQLLTSGAVEYDLGTLSARGDQVACTVSTPVELGEIAVAAVAAGGSPLRARKLTNFNGPVLKQLELSKPRSQWIKSEDGTRVQVWSMRPVGHRGNRKVPAVLEVHGGPHAQYGSGFFHEFQLLAATGHAVFYCNPRGSKGYGAEFCSAIRGNWGTADWEDIQAVTAHMQATSWVDSKRLAIMGGSYGGYMANWAIGHSRDYRAAITDRCVANLVSMYGSSDIPEEPDRYFPGNNWDRPEALWQQSPLKYFGKVRTPTLVIHSEGDLRCNVEQGEQVFTALKLRNIPTRLVRYPASTSHGMSRGGPPDLRIDRLQQILGWFARYLTNR